MYITNLSGRVCKPLECRLRLFKLTNCFILKYTKMSRRYHWTPSTTFSAAYFETIYMNLIYVHVTSFQHVLSIRSANFKDIMQKWRNNGLMNISGLKTLTLLIQENQMCMIWTLSDMPLRWGKLMTKNWNTQKINKEQFT